MKKVSVSFLLTLFWSIFFFTEGKSQAFVITDDVSGCKECDSLLRISSSTLNLEAKSKEGNGYATFSIEKKTNAGSTQVIIAPVRSNFNNRVATTTLNISSLQKGTEYVVVTRYYKRSISSNPSPYWSKSRRIMPVLPGQE